MTKSDYCRFQRTIANAIRVAIGRECVSLDLDPNTTETKKLVVDACNQVTQVYRIEIDLDIDPRLGEAQETDR